MPKILPVSDLRNYKAVISQVSYGNPVYLTKNGRGDVALVNIQELDELRALKGLFTELEKGEGSARKDGWISLDDAEKRLGLIKRILMYVISAILGRQAAMMAQSKDQKAQIL